MRSYLSFILSTIFISTSYAQTNVIDGHEYVDMGLPSGTLWATCNIGATSSTDFGDYFAWGETEPKEEYTDENYKFFEGYKELPGVGYYLMHEYRRRYMWNGIRCREGKMGRTMAPAYF